jgi:hypothetical protein
MPTIEVSDQLYSQLLVDDSTDDIEAELWQLLYETRRDRVNR